ncbi:MAG: DUF4856 domain-containing protein [Proteobacteria bacterium]|nr:DUF4856 domain-containing protein [Pseudomonadota bacterium]MCP4920847.1 DUF4856 domain-containing protein [Pseudomonadota bacterium]
MTLLLLSFACTDPGTDSGVDSSDSDSAPDSEIPFETDPAVYDFRSAINGEDSVSYGGQVFRQLLIDDMKAWIGTLTDSIDGGDSYPADGDVELAINFYLDFDSSVGGQAPHLLETDPAATSTVYDDIGSGKNLTEKIAGNDETGQHKVWTEEFAGWEGAASPEALVRDWIGQLDDLAAARVAGEIPTSPSGEPITSVYVTAEGQDLQQLLQKFLRASIAFSQGTDDYLDDDTDDKGLRSAHDYAVDGKPYTELEHAWDEGFGYFGATRTYGGWTDAEISDRYMDADGDGAIDLATEYSWGHSVNAGKRDAGSVSGTDFTAQAWGAFWSGRELLARTAGADLSTDDYVELRGYRDEAVAGWENAVGATCIHYINDVLVDSAAIGTDDYSFEDHAKHWSELKGFALALQFNPASPLDDDQFILLHELIRDAPAVEEADAVGYTNDLITARSMLGDAYGFDQSDLGDANGENGW